MREEKGSSLILFPCDYTLIDIETTGLSAEYDSIIELSAIKVRNNCIVDEFSRVVRESDEIKIDPFITMLTGITQKMVDRAPYTVDVLAEYIAFIGDDIIIGHNVNFDINFIYENTEMFYGKPFCNDFIDTMRISRKLFCEERHHRLSDISERLNINYDGAHRGLVDCNITKLAYDKMKCLIDDSMGEEAFINSFCIRRKYQKYEHLNPEDIEPNEDCPLYGKTCVITGALERFSRVEAMNAIERVGGLVGTGITKKTNFLILGNNDYCSSIKDGKSSKQKKAEAYKLEGIDIEIIPESVFYEMLGVRNK